MGSPGVQLPLAHAGLGAWRAGVQVPGGGGLDWGQVPEGRGQGALRFLAHSLCRPTGAMAKGVPASCQGRLVPTNGPRSRHLRARGPRVPHPAHLQPGHRAPWPGRAHGGPGRRRRQLLCRLRAAPAPQPAPCPRRSRPGEWPRRLSTPAPPAPRSPPAPPSWPGDSRPALPSGARIPCQAPALPLETLGATSRRGPPAPLLGRPGTGSQVGVSGAAGTHGRLRPPPCRGRGAGWVWGVAASGAGGFLPAERSAPAWRGPGGHLESAPGPAPSLELGTAQPVWEGFGGAGLSPLH